MAGNCMSCNRAEHQRTQAAKLANTNCCICDCPDCDFAAKQASAQTARAAWVAGVPGVVDTPGNEAWCALRRAANSTHAEMLAAQRRCEKNAVNWRARCLELQASHDAGLYTSDLWCVLSSGYMLSPSIVKLYLSRELAEAACALSAAQTPGLTYEVEELQSFMYSQRCTHEDNAAY